MSDERDDVARLASEARLLEAAELAASRGRAEEAGTLFERACEWGRAAEQYARSPDGAASALTMAARSGDEALASALVPRVVALGPKAHNVAAQLTRERAFAIAARVLEGIGDLDLAARTWWDAGEPVRAASAFERAGNVIEAGRSLEQASRRDPARADVSLALGELLLRFGKTEAGARALQRVAGDAPERRRALTLLSGAFEALDMPRARADADAELEALGGPVDDALAEAPARPATRLFGRYEVVREVASSASARVVECIDSVRGDHVAVKVFAGYDARGAGRDALARFEREVRILARVDHPGLVPLRDYIADGPAIVLAWMSGGTLEQRIAERAITPARAVEIACALLAVLGEAHRLGVLHRDVKPANVLFDEAGAARLADFGVAHLGDLSATATAGVIGTLAYMSPEQREGRPATPQSDVYAVGAILFEMLTSERFGRSAGGSSTASPRRGPHADETRARPSGAHRDLHGPHDAAVLAMLAPDPSDRPGDAFDARRVLLALTWPDALEPAAPRAIVRAPSERPQAGRADIRPDGTGIDRWTERTFDHVPLDASSLARAAAFARAGHPSLQLVLRVDRDTDRLWLESMRAHVHDSPPRLTDAQARSLEGALDALHAHGVAHGSVDTRHIAVDADGRAVLLFAPTCDATGTVDRDRLALARLASGEAPRT